MGESQEAKSYFLPESQPIFPIPPTIFPRGDSICIMGGVANHPTVETVKGIAVRWSVGWNLSWGDRVRTNWLPKNV
jgi:hypothetical protein